MKPLPAAAKKLVLLLCLAMPTQAADQMARLFAQPGSNVTISGDNNFHTWEVRGNETDGFLEYGAGFPTTAGQVVKLGKMQARVEGFVPVRSLHGNEGKVMDKTMYLLLKAEANPRIRFHFSELSLKAMPKSKDDAYLFDSQAELVVAGVTNRLSATIAVIPLGGQKLKITGSASAKLTNLGIQPPEFKASNGNLTYRDEIELSFEWFVGPKASP